MKRFLLILFTVLLSKVLLAEHITGGQMFYTFSGQSGNDFTYHVTLLLYRDSLSSGAPLDASAPIAIYNNVTGVRVWSEPVDLQFIENLHLKNPGSCITNPPTVIYQVGHYEFDVTLPGAPGGYTIAYQRCCRISGINNLVNSSAMGATYTAVIPGTSNLTTGPANNSAHFIGSDTVVTCAGYPFSYSFKAEDPDGTDQLVYSFCNAYTGGGQDNTPQGGPNTPSPNPPVGPPYNSVFYANPYSPFSPMGPGVSIDNNTGMITGTTPEEGIYVVTVCVSEVRQGVVIAIQRKDLQIKVGGCQIAKAQLNPQYVTCDGFTLSFFNLSNSPLINSYYWDFGDVSSGANNISNVSSPTHTFSVAGDYPVKLVTNRNQECSDSTTTIAKVWPGFFPKFTASGICIYKPVLFDDQTTTNYGVVNSWQWDFGDDASITDVSDQPNPSWQYTGIGPKHAQLIVGSSKGCVDTVYQDINVIDKPPITLAFRDTLICVPDTLQLQASGMGNFSWTPLTNIIRPNTGTPTVNPSSTTIYHVQLDEQGCVNNDSVQVRVVTFVTLNPMGDSTICRTDTAQLHIVSDGLRFSWTPIAAVNDPTLQNPLAVAGTSTLYTVSASIGSCVTTRDINITAVPYPVARAGADTSICYNTPAFLHGSHDGNNFFWSPVNSLLNPNTLNPVAYPADTMAYILSSFDTRGCPKPGYDTVLVSVAPRIRAYAGSDTLVIVGQPLQLTATGGVRYSWSPPTGLSNTGIPNPIAVYDTEVDSIRYMVEVFNDLGCSDSAFVNVVVFKTNPYVFVPTAFTPNGDGKNDVVKPVAVGVKQINYFRIFNRWGQMVFNTTVNGQGWDGRIAGTPQGSNVYVWMVSAIDYTGKPIFLKGTVTLIR